MALVGMHKQISWWCGFFALLMCGMGCAGSEPASPSSVASEDTGNIIDDAGDEQADTSGDDTNGQDSSDEDTGSEDTSPEDEPDAVDDCGCEVGEICISNDTVEDACFPRDCPGEQCDSGFVCMDGACVSVPCAGVDCGGYPNVCRGGVCQVGNCSDPDVSCPAGQQCISNDCLTICTSQEDRKSVV